MEHPKDIGDRTALAVMYALRECGYALLVPFGENTRYDLALDDGEKLFKVQCKTGRLRHGSIAFSVASTYGHHPNPKVIRRNYTGEVDFFAIYCPETRGVYLVPIDRLPNRSMAHLRVEPARNGQSRRVRRALDYEIGRADVRLSDSSTPEPGARAGDSGSSA